ncbi:MAG TPA: hypothetical protein VL405_01805 [Sphingomonas sp.]|jgi:Gpi18-like mannosyltransferase|nr:hypothetical protein [Sphingomonas sp.]
MPAALPRLPVTLVIAGAMHFALWPLIGEDLGAYLVPWWRHIVETGPIAAFATPFSNYNPLYLYLLAAVTPSGHWIAPVDAIKLLSLAGTAALGAAMYRLLRALDAPQPARAAALVLLVPGVVINAAVLGQCDALWSAAALMAVTAAVERRHRVMFGWTGIALAFKLQAIFILPFVAAVMLADRVRWRDSFAGPAVYLAALLPAALAGWPLADLLTIYLRQTSELKAMSLNAPNLWMLLPATSPAASFVGVALAGAAALGLVVMARVRRPQGSDWLTYTLAASIALPMFLPRMHERYFFLADVLALAAALTLRSWRGWLTASLVITASALSLLAYATSIPAYAMTGAVMMITALALVVRSLRHQPDGGARWSSGAVYPVQP